MLKLFLVKLLLRLTSIPNAPLPDEKTETWLAEVWLNDGMRKYLHARERSLERFLSRGYRMAGVDYLQPRRSADYILAVGQLQELTNFMTMAKNAYEAKQKRLSTPQRTSA